MNILRTESGYLENYQDWTPDIALSLALEDELKLTDDHWLVINILRDFYSKHQKSLSIRALVNLCKKELDANKYTSLYLQKLFPNGAAKQANKIAGLPKPIRCI